MITLIAIYEIKICTIMKISSLSIVVVLHYAKCKMCTMQKEYIVKNTREQHMDQLALNFMHFIGVCLFLDAKCKNRLPKRKCEQLKKYYRRIDACRRLRIMRKYCEQSCGLCGEFAKSTLVFEKCVMGI